MTTPFRPRSPLAPHKPPSAEDVVITFLEQKLAEAKAGKLVGVGLISIYGPGGLQIDTHGQMLPSDLVAGAEQMKKQVLEQMFAPVPPATTRLSS